MFFCLDYLNYKKTKISTPTQRCGAGAGRRRTFWLEPEPEPEKRPAPVPAPAPVILVYFTSQNISLLPFNYKDKIDHFCVMTAKSVNSNVYFPSCQLVCEPFEGWKKNFCMGL